MEQVNRNLEKATFTQNQLVNVVSSYHFIVVGRTVGSTCCEGVSMEICHWKRTFEEKLYARCFGANGKSEKCLKTSWFTWLKCCFLGDSVESYSMKWPFLKQKYQTFAGSTFLNVRNRCCSLSCMIVNKESFGFRLWNCDLCIFFVHFFHFMTKLIIIPEMLSINENNRELLP